MTKRNASIELYRLVMMFFICWLHCAQQGGRFEETRWVYYLLRFSVVGFIFMSGYFGIVSGIRKILNLILIGISGAVLSVMLRYLTSVDVNWHVFVSDVAYSMINGYWFLWAYIALMLVARVLNAVTEGDTKVACIRMIPFLMLVFGWSYVVQLPGVTEFIPKNVGFGPTSVLTFSAIYVVARIVRTGQYDNWMTWPKSLVIIAVTAPVCCLGFSHYNSIFSLLLAFAVFCLFKRFTIWKPFARLVVFVGPSMFAIYILHQCCRGFGFVGFGMSLVNGILQHPILQTFLAAVIVFVLCLLIDLLFRRGIMGMIRRLSSGRKDLGGRC